MSTDFVSALRSTCLSSLESNLVETEEGVFLRAGQHQFGSFWTRDFAFSAAALIQSGHVSVVKNQIDWLLGHLSPEGWVPRGFDVVNPKWRVLSHTLFHYLPRNFAAPVWSGRLRPEWYGEHSTPSVDGNALIVLAALPLKRLDPQWWNARQAVFRQLLEVYAQLRQASGLLHQPAYSDWQDSLRREGPGFYLHVLVTAAARGLNLTSHFATDASWQELIVRTFWDPEAKLYRQSPNSLSYPFEANLLTTRHELFVPTPNINRLTAGLPNQGLIALSEVAWTTRLVGLSGYHTDFIWSWLLGLWALTTGEQAFLSDWPELKLGIGEIYDPQTRLNIDTGLYRSERPFSWGAALLFQALTDRSNSYFP